MSDGRGGNFKGSRLDNTFLSQRVLRDLHSLRTSKKENPSDLIDHRLQLPAGFGLRGLPT
ncbi:hypothetical protein U0070_024578 [Myodes glareolus]|uniref:Uncharacterized protein n=1 Tax=Myodes glareolus TaxID=447135 RepID=A0AAW0IDU4_MYOGA